MRSLKSFLLIGLFIVAGSQHTAWAQLDPAREGEIAREITAQFRTYAKAMDEGDIDTAVSFYAHDPRFFWIENGSLRYEDPRRIREDIIFTEEDGETDYIFSAPKVTVLSETWAQLYTKFRTHFVNEEDDVTLMGTVSIVLEKREDRWFFLSGHTSSFEVITDKTD